MLIEGVDSLTNAEFCLLTNEPIHSDYNYTAVVGFGKPDDTYEGIMDSTVGEMWAQHSYKPEVTYDLNFDGTMNIVRIGAYDGNTDNDLFMTTNSSAESTSWALPVASAGWDTNTYDSFTKSAAVLDSSYPYMAVPKDMWDAV